MTDETEKLAAQMRNLKPSKKSREAGLNAAMAAFDAEFAAAPEKNSTSTQGSADALRPTGKPTKTVRVKTRRVEAMSKFTNIFQKPQAMMMAGTCGAALIAALVVMPNMDEFGFDEAAVPVAPVAVNEPVAPNSTDSDTIVVTASRAKVQSEMEPSGETTAEDAQPVPGQRLEEFLDAVPETPPAVIVEKAPPPPAVSAPTAQVQGGIGPVNRLLTKIENSSAQVESENKAREQQFRQRIDQRSRFVDQSGQTQIMIPGKMIPSVPMRQKVGGLSLEEIPAEYKVETKEIVLKEAFTEFVETPPDFETVLETIVVEPASVELVEVPATYEWVDGNIDGSTIEYVVTPPVYETISEPVIVQEAMTELVSIPATYNPDGTIAVPARVMERMIPSVTKTETRRVVKTPASTVERIVPYEKRDGKTRVPVTPGRVIEKEIPAVTKQVERRVIRRTSMPIERNVPAGTKRKVQVRTEVSPQKFYLRDDDGNIVREFDSRDAFEKYKLNATTAVSATPVSTFSVDVDTASYSFLRASINRGRLPPRESIRLEEMINYFPYAYDAPKSAETPFNANVTVTPNPWNADTKLMHIGIKGYVPKQTEKPRSNLVFLIDTSGSMNQPNKLPLLVNSFKLLLNTLDEDDTVSIVAYASASGTVLEPTPVSKKSDILNALNNLRAGGSTAGAAGLELAYQKAKESFDDEGVNRVILATDGDFNVGFSSPDEMKDFIKEKRETGIFLSVLGFGMGNYNDHLMQSLAQNGNGVAAYIDTLSEANKVLANEAGSALFTIAKDVKIQVEFNPATVAEYRLIGYETRALKRQDFNNDKVDAGEIGAGHSVTAIYEMTPVGSPAITIDKLRYASEDDTHRNTGSDEYAFVKIRHKLPDADKSTLQTFPIGKRQERRLSRASDDMRFATAVSIVGQKLRGDMQVDDYSYAEAIKLANSAKGEDENGYRAEFIQMVKLIEAMGE